MSPRGTDKDTDNGAGRPGRSAADELLAAALASGKTLAEAGKASGVSERTAKTCPIKAQSTAGLVGPASICNAERARFGGTSGHVGVVRRFL